VYGYSLGGGVALQMGVRHPGQVRKLVVVSAPVRTDGNIPEVTAALEKMTPEMFDGTPFRETYNRVAPDPEAFPIMVRKMTEAVVSTFDWTEAVGAMSAPTLTIIGDADGMRPEHAAEMFRLGGGGAFGDMAGLPASRLAVLPGTSHLGLLERAGWIAPMVEEFLAAPMPEAVA
jgi:pimeloyl-ACP methyl ester carboxylesterase